MKYLSDPASIRQSLVRGLVEMNSLDAAVAFIGTDWANILGTFSGPVRVVCWLSSTNTNPYAVEQMMQRDNIHVCHLPAMHAKVYVLQGIRSACIVGSANLTGAALSEENASGQYEAAVYASGEDTVQTVARWFDDLWEDAHSITEADLVAAKDAWKKARSSEPKGGNRRRTRNNSRAVGSHFPVDWKPPQRLVELAKRVKDSNFSEFADYENVLSEVTDRGWKKDVEQLIGYVAKWTGHPGAYRPALKEKTPRIRQAFNILFDHSSSVEERLRSLDSGGSAKIAGFGLPALTMILYWKMPEEYPPFNRRTQKFLKDFKFDGIIPKHLSPSQYGKWLSFAQELSARLGFRSTGHIDRLVWEYTRELEIEA